MSPDEFYSQVPGAGHSWGDGKDLMHGILTALCHQNYIEKSMEDTLKGLERRGYLQVLFHG